MKKSNRIVCGFIVVIALGVIAPARAAVLVEYDAATENPDRPNEVTPAWTKFGTDMTHSGTYLLQDNTANDPTQDSGEYLSPSAPSGTMVNGSGQYVVSFRVRPLTDMPDLGGGQWNNSRILWEDNLFSYDVEIDLDTDDGGGGTTGAIRYGQNSLTPTITGIDWSTPHTVMVHYRGSSDVFDFYLDGSLQSTVVGGSIARPNFGGFALNRLDFGDGTTAGTDVALEWYNVALFNELPVPEPSTVMLLGLGSFLVWRRRLA